MTEARIRKAYLVSTRSHRDGTVVYAPNGRKARAQVILDVQSAWGCSFREALTEVGSVHRWPARDVVLPPRHPLAPALSEQVLHCVVHAHGGRGIKAGYRDHYYAGANDWVMRAALWHGLFRVVRRDKSRDRALVKAGWSVLRFTGSEVVRDTRACLLEALKTFHTLNGNP